MGEWDVRIISVSYSQGDDDVVMEIFGKTREGESITVLHKGFKPYFHIVEPTMDALESLRKSPEVVSVEPGTLYDMGKDRDVAKVTLKYPWSMSEYRSKYGRSFRILSGDVSFHYRYVYDMDMGSCIRVRGDPVEGSYTTDLVVEMVSFENVEPFNPPLKTLSFDLENSIKHDFIYTICAVVHEGDEIRECEPITGPEVDIIDGFTELIRREDPDVITGYNIDNYDIKKIVERAEHHKMRDRLAWGRDGGVPRIVTNRFWRVKGRLVVDAWWAVRRELRPKQETLNAVSMLVLGERKLDVDPKRMDEEWAADRDRVIEYCTMDASLSLRILLEIETVRKGMDLAAVSMLPVGDVLTSGTSTLVDSLLIRRADREGIGVPPSGNRGREDQIEGGYVHEVKPGVYDWVCVLDFKSMYPSLIISKNICFTTLSPDGEIVSPSGARYVSRERKVGLLPRILDGLMKQRDSIKARMKETEDDHERHYLDGLQAAVKILMNTFYGVFASSFYRFTDKNIGASITAFARASVKNIIKTVESEGISVVYSDTDSIFIQSPARDMDGAVAFGGGLAERFSKEGETLEFEKILHPLFTHGKKKRYVGKIVWPEPDDELFVRGYEVRRTDSFDIQGDSLMEVFSLVLAGDTEGAVAYARGVITDILNGKVDPARLVISQTSRDESQYKNPDSMASVQAARKIKERGYEFIPGMKVSWIVTDSKVTPQTVEPYVSGVPFEGKPDYQYYAGRIAQTLARVTEVFGWDEKDLMMGSQQATLFDWQPRPAARKKAEGPPAEPKAKPKEKPKKKTLFDF
ncbi:MAG: DNA polymerase II [Thermoplasmatales archaeon]|nr:DNA polymerase II [Thermoplasmatales archaeon]